MIYLYYGLTVPLLALLLFVALFPAEIRAFFNGGGKRRATGLGSAPEVFPTSAEIKASDATDDAPKHSIKAPVDNGSRDTPRANAETVQDMSLAAMAQNDEDRHRLAVLAQASSSDVTLPRIPVVVDIQATTEVSPTAINRAVQSVAQVLQEAS